MDRIYILDVLPEADRRLQELRQKPFVRAMSRKAAVEAIVEELVEARVATQQDMVTRLSALQEIRNVTEPVSDQRQTSAAV